MEKFKCKGERAELVRMVMGGGGVTEGTGSTVTEPSRRGERKGLGKLGSLGAEKKGRQKSSVCPVNGPKSKEEQKGAQRGKGRRGYLKGKKSTLEGLRSGSGRFAQVTRNIALGLKKKGGKRKLGATNDLDSNGR